MSHMTSLETAGRILLVRPELLRPLAELHGRRISTEAIERIEASAESRTQKVRSGSDDTSVATVSLKGVLRPTPSLFALLFGGGGSGLLGFRDQMREAAADSKVSAIVVDVDSPGGMVDLIPEVAAEVRNIAAQKPVVAVANTMAGSAAYWIASQASEVVVTPSGEVGSIGVYQMHVDESQALDQEGLKVSIVKAGKYKIEANPYEPLNDEAHSAIQADVNDYYDMFTSDVAKGRGVDQQAVKDGYGEGRMLLAKRAVKAGLADRVDTLEATVRRMGHPGARAALMRGEHEHPNFEANEPEDEIEEVQPMSREDKDRVLSVLAGLR